MDEDIDVAGDAEERESPLHDAARELIEKVEAYLRWWDKSDIGDEEQAIRDAIARLEAILKENP